MSAPPQSWQHHRHHRRHQHQLEAAASCYGNKASTLAGWSNLPGKALLVDQLARLRARSSPRKAQAQQQASSPPRRHQQHQQDYRSSTLGSRCACPLTTTRCHCCRCSALDVHASTGPRRQPLPWRDRSFFFARAQEENDDDYWHRDGGDEEAEAPEWLNVEKSVRFSLPGSSSSSRPSKTVLPTPAPLSNNKSRRRLFHSSHEVDRACDEEDFFPTDFVSREEERMQHQAMQSASVIVKTPLSLAASTATLTKTEEAKKASATAKKSKEAKSSFAQRFFLRGEYGTGKKKIDAASTKKTTAESSSGGNPSSSSSGGEGSDPGYESDPAAAKVTTATKGQQQQQEERPPVGQAGGGLSPVTMELFVPIRVRLCCFVWK